MFLRKVSLEQQARTVSDYSHSVCPKRAPLKYEILQAIQFTDIKPMNQNFRHRFAPFIADKSTIISEDTKL